MKNLIPLIALTLLASCKTRQATTAKTSTVDKTVTTKITKTITNHTDSTKTVAQTMAAQTERDSLEIDITPDTGTIHLSNGSFTGRARRIVIKDTRAKAEQITQQVQQTQSGTTQQTVSDSTTQKNNITIIAKNKQVTAKGLAFGWLWPALLLLGGVVTFIAYKKLRA